MEKTGFGGLEAWFLEPSLGSKQQLELTGMKKRSGDQPSRRQEAEWGPQEAPPTLGFAR